MTQVYSEKIREWSIVDTLAVAYVVLPALLFLVNWISFPLGLVAALLVAVHFVVVVVNETQLDSRYEAFAQKLWFLGLVAGFSALWASMGGAGHIFYANPFDWVPRFALARDLAAYPWPIAYFHPDGEMLLRAPVAYYLLPALLASRIGLHLLDPLLYVWTTLGVSLFFMVAFRHFRVGTTVVAMLLFSLASGLDFIGYLLVNAELPRFTEHIEWWARRYQYSSNSTLLFWVPNHTLAAWIATALLVRYRQHPIFLAKIVVLLAAPLMLWSPLSAVGFIFLYACILPGNSAQGAPFIALARTGAVQLLPCALIVAYLLHGVNQIPPGFPAANDDAIAPRLLATAIFFALEAGIFSLLLLSERRDRLRLAAVCVLALLPALSFGGGNDLVMRASIPALAVLWLGLIDDSLREKHTPKTKASRTALFLLWCIGLITPANEMARVITYERWAPSLDKTLPEAFASIGTHQPFPPHYFTRVGEKDLLRKILRSPQPVQEGKVPTGESSPGVALNRLPESGQMGNQ